MKTAKSLLPLVLALLAGGAQANMIFDHESYNGTSDRVAEYSPGTYFSAVAVNTTINGISVLNDLNSNGQLRFVIFDHPTETLVYASAAKSFVDDGMSWKASDAFSFTLLAGHQYDIGAVADVGGQWAYDYPGGTDIQNGLTASAENSNFLGFASPTDGNHAATIIPIRLTSAVPEPETYALMLAGLGMVGFLVRRK